MSDAHLHDFWEASALNSLTITNFGAKVIAYEDVAQDYVPDPLATAGEPYPLPLKTDRLHKTLQRRRSGRAFGDRPLSAKELGQILGAVSGQPQQRLYPSAGGLASVEVFALLHNVDTKVGRAAVRYLPVEHALAPLATTLPPIDQLDELLSLEGNRPAVVFVFAVRMDQLIHKYGPRGGRFALIEVGHACQNIALRLAADGLTGYQLGGTLDHDLEQLLDISGRAHVTLGYAIGHPA